MSWAIPVERLYETETLVAFRHPKPSYVVHILIVPKREYRSLLDVLPEDTPLLGDLIAAVQALVSRLHLDLDGYRVIANGGAYQDVAHLHLHLVSGRSFDEACR